MILYITTAMTILIGVLYHNTLVRKKNQIDSAGGAIDTILKSRQDLIPNLVETIKAYTTHETGLLAHITALCDRAQVNMDPQHQCELTQNIHLLLVNSEAYPDLKASENFKQLQQLWAELESRLSVTRRCYNSYITEYNNMVETFPTSIMAKAMRYGRKSIFMTEMQERHLLTARQLYS